jgi:hypothetical protein
METIEEILQTGKQLAFVIMNKMAGAPFCLFAKSRQACFSSSILNKAY